VTPRKRYEATVDNRDLDVWMKGGWEVDGDYLPIGDRRPICWRRVDLPHAFPVGWRAVAAGRVWQ
jgi:hypothetical protein